MKQTRIVVRDSVLEDGYRLLETTKLGSLSELFNVLIARYGKHLESTWVLPPNKPSFENDRVDKESANRLTE